MCECVGRGSYARVMDSLVVLARSLRSLFAAGRCWLLAAEQRQSRFLVARLQPIRAARSLLVRWRTVSLCSFAVCARTLTLCSNAISRWRTVGSARCSLTQVVDARPCSACSLPVAVVRRPTVVVAVRVGHVFDVTGYRRTMTLASEDGDQNFLLADRQRQVSNALSAQSPPKTAASASACAAAGPPSPRLAVFLVTWSIIMSAAAQADRAPVSSPSSALSWLRSSPPPMCLTLTNSSITEYCTKLPTECRLNFCGQYALRDAVSNWSALASDGSQCRGELEALLGLEKRAKQRVREFQSLVSRYNCQSRYSVKWKCTDCIVSANRLFLRQSRSHATHAHSHTRTPLVLAPTPLTCAYLQSDKKPLNELAPMRVVAN